MQITTITRKVSGLNYDNISATATLEEGESPIEAAKKLDAELRKMLSSIDDNIERVEDLKREKEDTVSLLERALAHAKDTEIPF